MAYDTWALETSVVTKLKNTPDADGQPMYRDLGKTEQQTLHTISPDGTTIDHIMGEISYSDIETFADELDVEARIFDPFIQHLFAKNSVSLVQLMRGVQYLTRSGFKGSVGSGNALDAIMLRAEQFQDPDVNANTARTSWTRTLPGLNTAAPGNGNYIESFWTAAGAAHGVALITNSTQGNAEAIAILGFANPAGAPCTSGYAIQYLGVNKNIQNLAFENVNNVYGDFVVELKQPLFIWPGESALVTVRYFKAGVDNLTPIGLWIKTAANLRALATS